MMTPSASVIWRAKRATVMFALTVSASCSGHDVGNTQSDSAREPSSRTAALAAPAQADSLVAIADRSRILGNQAAPVWVVIVSDFQCPYCKVWHDRTFPALVTEFVETGRIRLAYLNLPLQQHQHAQATAEMALCAGTQGRFWEFHDAIFDTQEVWTPLPTGTPFFLDTVATTARVDREQLRACMEARAMQPLVRADYDRALAARARSTPTFFIGDAIRIEGAHPIEVFRDSIAKALQVARAGAG